MDLIVKICLNFSSLLPCLMDYLFFELFTHLYFIHIFHLHPNFLKALDENQMEKSTPMGLVMGHAYAMTGLKEARVSRFGLGYQDPLPLVRMRNPWGGIEWKGPFSDK